MRHKRIIIAALVSVLLCGCTSSGPVIRDTLDPVTSITITHANMPIVFYRNNYLRAASYHDFLSMEPLQTNLMGRYGYFLWLAIWNTTLNEHLADEQYGFSSMTLLVDGEALVLDAAGSMPDVIGASRSVYGKPFATSAQIYYEVTLDQLRVIADAADIRIQSTGSELHEYVLWDSPESAHDRLQAFMDYLDF